MKKSTIWLGLCVLLALTVSYSAPSAQLAPQNEAMTGVGMQPVAESFVSAVKAEDYEAMFEALAPWKQNAAALVMERMVRAIDKDEFTEEQAEKLIERGDPSGTLGLKTRDDLKAAPPSKILALHTGMPNLVVSGMKKKERLAWYITECLVGLQPPRREEMPIMPWGGFIKYENSDGDTMDFTLALSGNKWLLIDYSIRVGNQFVHFSESLRQAVGAPKAWTSAQRARASEGEQMLGSAKGQARVAFAKTGLEDAYLVEFERVKAREFAGRYYSLNKFHPSLPGSDFDAGFTAYPANENDPWLLSEFNWAGGEGQITWYDSKQALEARVLELLDESEDE